MSTKSRRPAANKPVLRRHALLIAAVTLFWAAENEPASLGLAPVAVWLLTAAAVAILACAAAACLDPAAALVLRLWPLLTRPPRDGNGP